MAAAKVRGRAGGVVIAITASRERAEEDEDQGREVQSGKDKTQRGQEEEDGSGIGGRGRGGVPGVGDDDGRGPDNGAVDAPPSRFGEGGPLHDEPQ